MADIISRPDVPSDRPTRAAQAADEDLVRLVELFFFAYRDFTGEPDAMLSEYGLGRAQHRALHFVVRHPGLRVTDLLAILKITKQSLARVLKPLIDDAWIDSRPGADDRRERLLYPTPKGRALIDRLLSGQKDRIASALVAATRTGDHALDRETLHRFLFAMIGETDRAGVASLIETATKRS